MRRLSPDSPPSWFPRSNAATNSTASPMRWTPPAIGELGVHRRPGDRARGRRCPPPARPSARGRRVLRGRGLHRRHGRAAHRRQRRGPLRPLGRRPGRSARRRADDRSGRDRLPQRRPRSPTEAADARDMGYRGKLCIHPRQVAAGPRRVHAVARTRSSMLVGSSPPTTPRSASGLAAIDFEGQMVDGPVVAQARHLIELGADDVTTPASPCPQRQVVRGTDARPRHPPRHPPHRHRGRQRAASRRSR